MLRQKVNLTASGEVVALQANRAIAVIAYHLVSTADFTATWQSRTSANVDTAISGPMQMIKGVPHSPPPLPYVSGGDGDQGLIQTAQGEALYLTLSGTGTVAGWVDYNFLP